MKITTRILLIYVSLAIVSCGTKKAAIKDNTTATTAQTTKTESPIVRNLAFVQKVSDTKVYVQNIVADMSFTATMDDKNITVPGSLHMRRDGVIRLQLFIPILGSEVGRLEFTPDYVLVIDRMHKQYVKGDYNQLDFLRDNGINFYSLQALFWNQLLLPGASKVGEADLLKFEPKLDGTGENVPVSLKNGNMSYVWTANRNNGLIGQANVTYSSVAQGKSELIWKYDNFKSLGAKLFPSTQEFSFSTTATNKLKKNNIKIEMENLSTDDGWETESTVSNRYQKIDAKDIFGKLLNM
ncbi:MAG: DUF4292 domain-containing protein [Bacteroidota bacterium]|nr:DUF4292 domain-containing protein [Bacteroidota bacterium]